MPLSLERHPDIVDEICRLSGINERRNPSTTLTKKEAQQVLAHIRAMHELVGEGSNEQGGQ